MQRRVPRASGGTQDAVRGTHGAAPRPFPLAARCFPLAVLWLLACDLGKVTVPKTTSTIVVHCVLNPAATSQVLLVERTLNGTVTVSDSSFDPNNPIASAGGIPVSDATVELSDSSNTFRGVQDTSAAGGGTGVYRFAVPGPQLRLGSRYELRVHTREGEDVTAFTRIPRPDVAPLNTRFFQAFNRDHDTLVVHWSRAVTRAYGVRIESPFGPFFLFTDSLHIRFPGDLRNLFARNLQRVFIPGFQQDLQIVAVDSNFYDYYRTNNDPFTGSGIISRVTGGLGLFGSLVSLTSGTLNVVADQTQPIEGRFSLITPTTDPRTPVSLTLYVESKAARDNLPNALSGRYATAPPNPRADGIIGEQLGNSVTLAFLANQLAGDTIDVFSGTLQGTTLTGSYRRSGATAVFLKR